MNWSDVLIALIWAGAVVWAVWYVSSRLERLVERRLQLSAAMSARPSLADTSEYPEIPASVRSPRTREPIPVDLEALATRESELWAQDDMRAVIREKFRELHTGDKKETWQRVRRAMGIGEMP